MYKSKVRLIPLTDEDEIIVRTGFAFPGALTEVSVHYRARIKERWMEVARWDNAHGVPHVHYFWRERPGEPLAANTTPTQLLRIATEDLFQHAFEYRARMELM